LIFAEIYSRNFQQLTVPIKYFVMEELSTANPCWAFTGTSAIVKAIETMGGELAETAATEIDASQLLSVMVSEALGFGGHHADILQSIEGKSFPSKSGDKLFRGRFASKKIPITSLVQRIQKGEPLPAVWAVVCVFQDELGTNYFGKTRYVSRLSNEDKKGIFMRFGPDTISRKVTKLGYYAVLLTELDGNKFHFQLPWASTKQAYPGVLSEDEIMDGMAIIFHCNSLDVMDKSGNVSNTIVNPVELISTPDDLARLTPAGINLTAEEPPDGSCSPMLDVELWLYNMSEIGNQFFCRG
jgi:hypothetical protein